jgi:hypothetical protein
MIWVKRIQHCGICISVVMKRKYQKTKTQTKTLPEKSEETIAGQIMIVIEALTRASDKARGLPVKEPEFSACVPVWYHNIADILAKTIFRKMIALDPKGQFEARNFGKTMGSILRGAVFFGKELEFILKKMGLLDLSKDEEKKVEDMAGIELLFPVASKKFNRPIRNENQLINQTSRHLEKWGIDLVKSLKVQLVHLWHQPIEEQHQFLCGMAEGFILFLDTEAQFSGDRGRTNLYFNLMRLWPEIAAMQKAEPRKTRRDLQEWLINEAKIPISNDEEWFDHLCDEIGLTMKRPPLESNQ